MSDWNATAPIKNAAMSRLNRTYEWLKHTRGPLWTRRQCNVEPYLWVIETVTSNQITNFLDFVEPYLWVIETSICKLMSVSALMLYVEPYLWVICCFCWTHCFIRILWIVSLIFKENTNKKMLQLIKSWSFFVKKFWLQEVGMYLQWRRCCPREIREMLLIISVWKRMGVALMVCRFLSWRINGRLIMSR